MKFIKDFLNKENIEDSEIFKYLECSKVDAIILKNILVHFINGVEDISVRDILSNMSNKDDEEVDLIKNLDNIKHINNLLDLGWLNRSSSMKNEDNSLDIFILNSSVTLSHAFLELIENGKDINIKIDNKKPYNDDLEYIKDQFNRVELYYQKSLVLSSSKNSKNKTRLTRFEKKIKELDDNIAIKLKNSKITTPLKNFISKYKLNFKEELIFLTLLREEYMSSDNNLRDMNTLIKLVSKDSYDNIKNRSIFDEDSKLIKEGLISFEDILIPFGKISRTFFVVEDVFNQVMNSNKNKTEKVVLETVIKEQNIFELVKPKYDLNKAVLDKDIESKLNTVLKRLDKKVIKRLVDWGIKEEDGGIDSKIIFYGVPGTGKTFTAHCLAKSLNRDLLNFDCSKILSMYVGESEKNVRSIFDTYYDICKKSGDEPILFLNEADQFLSSRGGVSSGVDQMHNQIQNIFLEQIENFDGILIATTNLLENLDKAFSRRFDYKIEFKRPDQKQRKELFKQFLPKNVAYEKGLLVDKLIDELSTYELTGGQIKLIIKNTSYKVAIRSDVIFKKSDFLDEIDIERSTSFDNSDKALGFI